MLVQVKCKYLDAKWAYLDNGRTSSSGGVRNALLAGGQDNVGLAGEALGNGHRETTIDRFGGNESWTSDSNKGSVNLGVLFSLQSVTL